MTMETQADANCNKIPRGILLGHESGWAIDTMFLMYNGTTKSAEAIKVGDALMGPDGSPRIVTNTTLGTAKMYRIEGKDGSQFECTHSHLLILKSTLRAPLTRPPRGKSTIRHIRHPELRQAKRGYVTPSGELKVKLIDFLEDSPTCNKLGNEGFNISQYWKMFRTGPIEFITWENSPIVPLEWYQYAGLWLGDGDSRNPTITTADDEIVEWLVSFALKHGIAFRISVDKKSKCTRRVHFHWSNDQGRALVNFLAHFLSPDKSNYTGHSNPIPLRGKRDKLIPHFAKTASTIARELLLAGIVDSDGYTRSGEVEIISVLSGLSEDITFVARSLGFRARSTPKKTSLKSIEYTGVAYRIMIAGDVHKLPLILPRKRQAQSQRNRNFCVYGWRAVDAGIGKYASFRLTGDAHCLRADFSVAHATP